MRTTITSTVVRVAAAAVATLALTAGSLAAVSTADAATTAAAAPSVAAPALASGWKARPEAYPQTAAVNNLAIPMDDGVVLRGDLLLPAGADGKAASGKFPVVVTITAYNKSVQQFAGGLAGGDPSYL